MGNDSLMLAKKEGSAWIYKVKNEGLMSAAASIGMIFLWDPEGGSGHINDYLELQDGYAKSGACMAIGLYHTLITDDCDTAKALLEEQINGKESFGRLGGVIGLGLAYAGSAREVFIISLFFIEKFFLFKCNFISIFDNCFFYKNKKIMTKTKKILKNIRNFWMF